LALVECLANGHTGAAGRWFAVAVFFVGVNMALLYSCRDGLGMSLPLATLVAGEASTLLRYLANDRWVFGYTRPSWHRCWKFHATVLASFALWALVTDVLAASGAHYLVASVAGNMSTVAWGLGSSFLWVWRSQPVASRPLVGDELGVDA
jgi:putative flippase GtrA